MPEPIPNPLVAENNARNLPRTPAPLQSPKTEKPPLGLKPRGTWIELRKIEILQALARYAKAGTAVPVEWIEELAELIDVDLRKR